MPYQIGDRVERIEDRPVISATIITIQEVDSTTIVELQYDEGGTGWWPVSCIRPLQT